LITSFFISIGVPRNADVFFKYQILLIDRIEMTRHTLVMSNMEGRKMPARPETLEEAHRRMNDVLHRHGHDLDEIHDANPVVEVVPDTSASLDSKTTLEEMFGKETAQRMRREAQVRDNVQHKQLPDF
jgi:hypothetical protein